MARKNPSAGNSEANGDHNISMESAAIMANSYGKHCKAVDDINKPLKLGV
jgi:hypothetical protein